MEKVHVYMFMISALGAIYMLHHGLTHSKIIETVTGTGFAIVSLAVFFGFNMHITALNFYHSWVG